MRLWLLNYEYPPVGGGAATATQALGRCFVEMGHEVTVITSGIGASLGESLEQGMRIVRIDTGRKRVDRASTGEMARFVWHCLRRIPALVREQRPDAAIVFFSIPCGPLGLWLRAMHGVPYVISLRGGDVPGFLAELRASHALLGPLRRSCLRNASAVVANSDSLGEMARRADGGVVHVIPNGVDTDMFSPAARPRASGDVRFIFVGRLTPQKRLSLAMQAMRLLRDEGGPAVRLCVVGDGPLRAPLEKEASERGVGDQVEWRGWVSRETLRDLYREADCLLQPSSVEGMPNTVLEGMASGLPAIASEGPGNRDVVTHGENGLLFPVDDLGALLSAMRRMAIDPSLRESMGVASRDRALERHSWRAAAQAYFELLSRRSLRT